MLRRLRSLALIALATGLAAHAHAQASAPATVRTPAQAPAPAQPTPKPQTRPHGQRVPVDIGKILVDDGDTVSIAWGRDDVENVRILGIDTPETRHLEHNLPYPQDFGPEARGFALGAFATATEVQLLRASTVDPFGRTLGYLFLNGRNYSVTVVKARLAAESVSHYGDNGFPKEAAEVLAAAKAAGPVPFEPPFQFRARMRDVTGWMKQQGMDAEK
jgi:endonuclease YncB( thermonuclease family)